MLMLHSPGNRVDEKNESRRLVFSSWLVAMLFDENRVSNERETFGESIEYLFAVPVDKNAILFSPRTVVQTEQRVGRSLFVFQGLVLPSGLSAERAPRSVLPAEQFVDFAGYDAVVVATRMIDDPRDPARFSEIEAYIIGPVRIAVEMAYPVAVTELAIRLAVYAVVPDRRAFETDFLPFAVVAPKLQLADKTVGTVSEIVYRVPRRCGMAYFDLLAVVWYPIDRMDRDCIR